MDHDGVLSLEMRICTCHFDLQWKVSLYVQLWLTLTSFNLIFPLWRQEHTIAAYGRSIDLYPDYCEKYIMKCRWFYVFWHPSQAWKMAILRWKTFTTGPCSYVGLPDGHCYIEQRRVQNNMGFQNVIVRNCFGRVRNWTWEIFLYSLFKMDILYFPFWLFPRREGFSL